MAAVLMTGLAGPAAADTAADAAAAAAKAAAAAAAAKALAAYEAHLAANEAAPVNLEEAAKYAETKKFVAAAEANGESTTTINSLLTSGTWVGYPVTTTVVESSGAADPGSGTELTPEQAALKAPDAAEVSQANTETADDAVDLVGVAASAQTWCTLDKITYSLKNGAGAKIWWYSVGERYCYNGYTITSRDPEPDIDHKIYQWAYALGWSWKGPDLTGSKGPAYYSWGGSSKGGLKTWRKGIFEYDPLGVGLSPIQRFPHVHLYEHRDGTYKWTSGLN
ncbi:hypothetical protein [Streptomyces sp. NPDC001139]